MHHWAHASNVESTDDCEARRAQQTFGDSIGYAYSQVIPRIVVLNGKTVLLHSIRTVQIVVEIAQDIGT